MFRVNLLSECARRGAVILASVLTTALALFGLIGCGPASAPSEPETAKPAQPPRPFARLFIQDLETSALRWADLRIDEGNRFSLEPLMGVEGFKTLDPARQKLVQMKEANGLICVGVRDDTDGSFESGWVLVRSGVGYIDHGDHGHWTFRDKPVVCDVRLDAHQGNPAHLYLYGGRFFLANDRLNGYTRIDPTRYEKGKDEPRFLVGGGNHITLAVADDAVGYSCWIDGGGPNRGRVDVTPVGSTSRTEPAYSFHLPSGGIHGAAVCSGKVFFAPGEGICWVEVDRDAKRKPEEVKIHHIDLGKDGDRPRRTGAFATHGRHVVFTTGKNEHSALAILDAAADPKPHFVPLGVKKGTQAVTPEVIETADGKLLAFVFHDRISGSDADDLLEVIALDPNGDGDWRDARVIKSQKVGASAVEGHFGHHDIAFDADRQFAIFTNPGAGTLSVLSMKTLEPVATFPIGGKPTALVAVGSRETKD